MPDLNFISPAVLPSKRLRSAIPNAPTCCLSEPPRPATGPNARRLAKWLAADWANKQQAMDDPQFWAHIHVCFRPLPWSFLNGYALYCESAYDFNLGAPYKTSVVLITDEPSGHLELVSYKLTRPDEYWLAAHEPHLLEPLTADQLVKMSDACNTIYAWDQKRNAYIACSRPGKACRIRRGGKERETYLDSKIMLTETVYSAWDLGRDPETDDIVWGPHAGPFVFSPVSRLDHLVPEEPASVAQSSS